MEIIFCKREVYIHEKNSDSNDEIKVGGQLQIIKNVKFSLISLNKIPSKLLFPFQTEKWSFYSL